MLSICLHTSDVYRSTLQGKVYEKTSMENFKFGFRDHKYILQEYFQNYNGILWEKLKNRDQFMCENVSSS